METVYDNLQKTSLTSSKPTLSLVVPCYKVAKYLPDFLASLESQSGLSRGIEVVFVIDGCPENSEELVSAWAQQTDIPAKVVVQPNKGLSEARNTGVRHALGTFVSFPDPDDELAPNYLDQVFSAVELFPDEDLFVTRLCLIDPDGTTRQHPLDYKFTMSSQVREVDLLIDPEMIHLQAASAFFRREVFALKTLSFSSKLKFNFEDAHLIARLLESNLSPRYILVPDAHYRYKQRSDGSSLVAIAKEDYSRYLNLATEAYLPLLAKYSKLDPAPRWLGNLILYDLWWLFRASLQMQSAVFALTAIERAELAELVRLTLEKVGPETIRAFRVVSVPEEVRAAWEIAATGGLQQSPVIVEEYDRQLQLQKLIFFSPTPAQGTRVNRGDKHEMKLVAQKSMSIEFLGSTWVRENIVWVSGLAEGEVETNSFEVQSEGQHLSFEGQPLSRQRIQELNQTAPLPKAPPVVFHPANRWKDIVGGIATSLSMIKRRIGYSMTFRLGALSRFSNRYRNAWALIDRDNQAHDNAEALYRYLLDNRPDVNAWFVINGDSSDFKRLRNEGFRVLPYGSKRHFLLMKSAKVLASSQADHYIIEPFSRDILTKTWNYVFLQHGVVHNSLHRWLNPKDIQILVTSTREEYNAFVQSDGLYKFSEKEVRLTEMPRHDLLVANLRGLAESPKHRTIVIMPTWRNYLLQERVRGGNEREPILDFYDSEFVKKWSGLLLSDELRALAGDPNTEVYFLPHPNIDVHWKELELPEGVIRASYEDGNAPQILARATLTFTDYSSQAFEGAYVGAPTIYFQFDRKEFFAGTHIASPGYFEHERDGFGPVVETLGEAEFALKEMLEGTHPRYAEYLERVESVYPYRDGRSSERIVREIEAQLRGEFSSNS